MMATEDLDVIEKRVETYRHMTGDVIVLIAEIRMLQEKLTTAYQRISFYEDQIVQRAEEAAT